MTALLSMAAFALACSISPGPVNVVALSAGAQHGFVASLRHVTGATVGFTLLLLLIGLGLHQLLAHFPNLIDVVKWAGVGFLLYMAVKLAIDNGRLGADKPARGPSFAHGAAMQWLNPKAWLASLAGMGAYAANGDGRIVWQFAALYFVICYLSIASWAYAGTFLRKYLREAKRIRVFNRVMAALLAVSAVYLVVD
ncbi:LysE family translocator [Paraburkholderia sp. MMS20-SJTR3]|uniref:LysE family translocator n=1 Tax=Paraburkholderia sejongensis TaxID=2886946 RepID=A0ABS8JU00_9BURK|nr:LysE family translocator [Paraburkholderia sp. MMS20-SJTR3]MCC8393381.1 LysE family translocator [Paraburkholderia sp. MMS20-SJTR3]